VEQFLERERDPDLRVLVVWEPILRADWRVPGASVLARLPDPRVRQFWDPQHLIAQEIARRTAAAGKTPPDCCLDNGFLWDEALLYAPGSHWTTAALGVFWEGPVWKAVPGLEAALHPRRGAALPAQVSGSATPTS
jgi:hypothetical protein